MKMLMTFSKLLRVMSILLYNFGNIFFFNRGVQYMGLVETMHDLGRAMYKKNIDKKEFLEKLEQMIEKARLLTMMTHDQQSYNDVIELVSFYIANGDRDLAEPVRSFIVQFLALTKGLSGEDYKYFKKLVMFYLHV